jgi:cytochrome P450 family 12
MMQPKTVKVYIPSVDSISQEFIAKIKKIRDGKSETPANFGNEVNRWSLESIACIALDTRLGIINDDTIDENAQTIISGIRDFFDYAYQLDVLPSIWRYYSTPTFKKFVVTSDKLTE